MRLFCPAEKYYTIWYSSVDKTIARDQQFTKRSQTFPFGYFSFHNSHMTQRKTKNYFLA